MTNEMDMVNIFGLLVLSKVIAMKVVGNLINQMAKVHILGPMVKSMLVIGSMALNMVKVHKLGLMVKSM